MTTRQRRPKIIWQVAEFDDPVQKTRFFSTLAKAIDYVFTIYPDPMNPAPVIQHYDEPCLRAWLVDDPRGYLLFVTNGALYEKSGYNSKPDKGLTIRKIQASLDNLIAGVLNEEA